VSPRVGGTTSRAAAANSLAGAAPFYSAAVYLNVDPESVVHTVARLRLRVHERFPESGLAGVADELQTVARASAARALWTGRPLISLRLLMGALALVLLAAFVTVVRALLATANVQTESLSELVQAIEAGTNEVVFVGIAIFFLASIESRIKRARLLAALHELRSLAHVVDMHQLTKDPERILGPSTPSSPARTLNPFELSRYLDYCSEMLSLLGKIAAMYARYTTDPPSLAAIDQIESLTSRLSNKVWQKIVVIHQGNARG
jgi:hypothetical protein